MIKANELRIGNVVSIYSNGTVKIPCYPIKKKILSVGIFKCECVNINEIHAQVEKWDEIETNMLAPIPLTEEILLKCGFIDYGYLELIVSEFLSIIWLGYLSIELEGVIHAVNDRNKIYLHQLQNLYFALIGEELEINL